MLDTNINILFDCLIGLMCLFSLETKKVNSVPLTFLFLSPRISVTHFATPGVVWMFPR